MQSRPALDSCESCSGFGFILPTPDSGTFSPLRPAHRGEPGAVACPYHAPVAEPPDYSYVAESVRDYPTIHSVYADDHDARHACRVARSLNDAGLEHALRELESTLAFAVERHGVAWLLAGNTTAAVAREEAAVLAALEDTVAA